MPKLTLRKSRVESPPVYKHLQDWDILEDGEVIGCIYEERENRPGMEWSWSITSMRNFAGRHTVKTRDYAVSLDEAKKAFRENWERLKAWGPDSTPLP